MRPSAAKTRPARPARGLQAGAPGGHRPKLLEQLCQALRSRPHSHRTEAAYCDWAERSIYSSQCPPPRRDGAERKITTLATHVAVKATHDRLSQVNP